MFQSHVISGVKFLFDHRIHEMGNNNSPQRSDTRDNNNTQQQEQHHHGNHHGDQHQQTQTLGRPRRSASQGFREKIEILRQTSQDLRDTLRQYRRRTDTDRTVSVPVQAPNITNAHKIDHLLFLAISDYTSKGFGDLNLARGERFRVFGNMSENGWWYGESLNTKEMGFLPESLVAPLQQEESLE